jgi:hypothetical protein
VVGPGTWFGLGTSGLGDAPWAFLVLATASLTPLFKLSGYV